MMNKFIILLTMLFLHIVDDYYLQGCLAKLKQKSWWEENTNDELYKNDYKIALIEHAFSWTFVMMLPITIMIYRGTLNVTIDEYVIQFIVNVILHAWIDNNKANRHKINLVDDQIYHICQVIGTWLSLFVL